MDEAQNAEPICEESYDDLDTVAEEAQNHLRNGMWSQGQDKYIQKEGALRALELLSRPLESHTLEQIYLKESVCGVIYLEIHLNLSSKATLGVAESGCCREVWPFKSW